MFKFLLNKIIIKILNNHIIKNCNIFIRINNNKNKLVILDIGGADGLQNRWKVFEKHIIPIFVEPDKRSYLELQKKGFEVITKALWSNETRKDFYLTNKSHTSSLYKPNKRYLNLFPESSRYDINETFLVDVVILDNQINSSNQPHFIKLDIQGAELEVLKGGVKTLKDVLGLEVEVNFKEIYEKIPLFCDVEKFLKGQGFILNDFVDLFRWERNQLKNFGEIVHGDVLFLRTPEQIIEISKNLAEPIPLFENYVKILFVYNKLDLIIKLSEYISEEHKKLLNLNLIILFLEKNQKRVNFLHIISSYLKRCLISNDLKFPHWRL